MRITHKLGKDWNIKPISKLNFKQSNEEIDKILYYVNDKLYFFNSLYMNSTGRTYLLNLLKDSGEKLKTINKNVERRNEILDRLRELYKEVLKIPLINDEYFSELVKKMGQYKMSLFIKNKKEGLSEEDIFKWIRYNKLFYDIYGFDNNICSIQNELLKKYIVSNLD